MPEQVLFKSESEQARADIASYLRTVADSIDSGGDLTLKQGEESVTLTPPDRPTFEVKAERETGSGPDELSVEFEIEWDDGTENSGSLEIE